MLKVVGWGAYPNCGLQLNMAFFFSSLPKRTCARCAIVGNSFPSNSGHCQLTFAIGVPQIYGHFAVLARWP